MYTDVYVEDASEYREFQLDSLIKEQLNIQSLYRGENYLVTESRLIPKGLEIGVELTDLLLGIVRTILLNKPDSDSKGVASRNQLVNELLHNDEFYSFCEKIRYFEWKSNRELTEVSFFDYIQLFLANHYK